MTPAARLAAVMEITDLLLAEWQRENPRPAEQVLKAYTRQRRYIGGGDRRALQEACFSLLRCFGRIRAGCEAAGLPPDGRSLALLHAKMRREDAAALCSGGYGPEPLNEREIQALQQDDEMAEDGGSLPAWLYARLAEQYGAETDALMAALMRPALPDLRVNRIKATPEEVRTALAAEGIEVQPVAGLPDALEAPWQAPVVRSRAYQDGLVEIQDRGSQAVIYALAEVLAALESTPVILDYCAGAGGKSLALASLLRNRCRILAQDADGKRLADLPPRAQRAGASCISIAGENGLGGSPVDLVLLDVPCSGTGTIRRHPDLPWRLTPAKLAYYEQAQHQVLEQAAPLVKAGGYLYYVTCSLLESENIQCVNDFLTRHPNFRVVTLPQIWDNGPRRGASWLEFLPHRQRSDGFFALLLRNQ